MKKLGKNYIYNTLYQLLMILMPLVTTPYAARVLGPQQLGIYSFTGANVNYFVLLANIGFSMYGQKMIASVQSDHGKRSQVFWNIVITKAIIASLAFGIFCVVNLTLFAEYQDIYWIQSISILSVIIDISWFFMGLENFRITVIRNLLVKSTFVILLFLLVKSPDNLLLYVLIIVAGNFFGNLTLWFQVKKYIKRPKLINFHFTSIIRGSVILFIPTIAINVYVTLNKTMIGLLDSKVNVGFFVQADTVTKLILALVTSLGTVMMPHMANLISEGKNREANSLIYKSFSIMTMLSVPLMFGIISISNRFTNIFYGKGFEPVGILLTIESISIVLIAWSNVLGVQYLVPMDKLKEYSLSVTAGAIFNIIANPIMLMLYGVNGSMVAMVLTELVVVVVQVYFAKGDINFRELFIDVPKLFIAGLIMVISLVSVNNLTNIRSDYMAILVNIITGVTVYIICLLLIKPKVLLSISGLIKERESQNEKV